MQRITVRPSKMNLGMFKNTYHDSILNPILESISLWEPLAPSRIKKLTQKRSIIVKQQKEKVTRHNYS
jgi:hypothetical protein